MPAQGRSSLDCTPFDKRYAVLSVSFHPVRGRIPPAAAHSYAQPMPRETPPTVREILDRRTGEEMVLNDRYLNPQMGRILRTLGFDKVWAGGEGAHLIDSDGQRYLDMFGGYGVFAIGRNHPAAIAALEEGMAARTGNLPQLGVTLLSGVGGPA